MKGHKIEFCEGLTDSILHSWKVAIIHQSPSSFPSQHNIYGISTFTVQYSRHYFIYSFQKVAWLHFIVSEILQQMLD